MTWFSTGKLDPDYVDAISKRKVSLWPGYNSKRNGRFFRMQEGEGTPYPRATKHTLQVRPNVAENVYHNAFFEMDEVAENHLTGTTGVGAAGIEMVVDVLGHPASAPDPHFGFTGISYDFTYTRVGFADPFHMSWVWNNAGGGGNDGPPIDVFLDPPSGHWTFWAEDRTGLDTDYDTNPPELSLELVAIAECWDIPVPPPPMGFAELNGVDSDVIYVPIATANGARWFQEFDIRPHSTAEIVVLGKTFNTTQWSGFTDVFCRFMGFLVDMGSPLNLDVWTTIRFEHAWTANDNTYRVFWDGVPMGTKVAGTQSHAFNTHGKRGPSFIGHYDLRNLQWVTGNPAAPIVLMDCPLIVNACDAGPDLLKGTTTNMVLPSCP